MSIHIVKQGDSLTGISHRYKISVTDLIRINGLSPSSSLVAGLALYIPDMKENRNYIIAPGDSLSRVAHIFGVTIPDIIRTNPGLSPEKLVSGQKISIPSRHRLTIETLAFAIPSAGESDVIRNLERQRGQLTYLAIVAYSFNSQGFAFIMGDDSQMIERSRRAGVLPLLMIRNYTEAGFSAELVGAVLQNPAYRRNLIRSLRNFINQKGYGGVSIDFEFIPPQRRDDFSQFLRELKNELGMLVLQVNVHAKTADNPTNRIVGGQDYRAIGDVADIVAVMTIDYGYPTGPPNPISPLPWMEQVLKYAIANIDREKIMAGMALYGYDWITPTNRTTAISVLNAQNRAIEMGSRISYDETNEAPHYQYVQNEERHVVWFDDIRGIRSKYQLIDGYRLRGVTFWQLSLDFPQNWEYIRQNITVIKHKNTMGLSM
ncbi:glycoside hydrolase family 18 protein [Peribacillus sp. SCS-155]|uniref:glycoside hydrolase family 18 protein n=1 Tax=Peribacillus sedimenti TaxID=3115297 RepID=UPI003906BA27